MGKIVKAIATVGLIVAGAITGNVALIGAGLSLGSSALASKSKAPRNSPEALNRLRANIDPLTPRKTVIGVTALATDIRDEEFTGDQAFFHRFIVCASHKVQSIDEIWFDDKLAWTAAGGVQGDAVGYLTVATITEGNAGNAINISARMGATRRYTGLAYVHLRYKLTGNSKKAESPYAQSITTRITIRGKGAALSDPRNPAHNMDDQSTWTWSDSASRNPALALLFYLLGYKIEGKLAIGKGIPSDRIDIDSFITAANLCDELVPAAGGGTEPRYRCDGVWSEGDSPTTVIDMLKACMNADLDDVGGKLRLNVFHNDLATPVADFSDNDIIDGFTWQPEAPLDATFNVVRGLYTDPSDASLYQQVDYPEQRETSPDGIDRIDSFNLPMVQSPGQAQRLAALRLARQQYADMFEAEFQASAWKVTKNSVIRLSFSQTGFSNKFFRVAEMEVRQDGVVPLKLREEDPAIYGDPPITEAISPIFSTPFDPALNPLVQAINLNEQTLIAISSQIGISVTATDTAITVSAHDREYRDKTVAIAGVVITVDAAGNPLVPYTTYYLYYDDGDRDGLNGLDPLEWKATTDFNAAQNSAANPERHFAGIVTTDVVGGTGTVGSGVGGVDGINGANGLNNARILIYQRAGSQPVIPSVTTTYTFATGILTGQNNSWTQAVPAADGNPLWVTTAAAIGTGATDTILTGEWASPVILAQDGAAGAAALNSARVLIYRRSATSPALPSLQTTYTFSSGVLTNLNNSWTTTIPAADGNPLWVSAATAASTGSTDTINFTEWATPSILVQDGDDGAPGANAKTLTVLSDRQTIAYNAAGSPTPTTQTTTFSTNKQNTTGTVNWTITDAAGVNRTPVTSFISAATGDSVTMTEAQFNSARNGTSGVIVTGTITDGTTFSDKISVTRVQEGAVGAAGDDGAPGLSSAVITLYRRAAESPAPVKPTSTSMVYTFATGVVTNTDFWSQTAPAANGFPLWVTQLAVSGTTATVTVSGASFSTPVIISRDGVSATTGLLTNEAHTVAAASNGTGYSLADAGGNFEVFFGGQNVRLTSTFSIVGGTDGGANWTQTKNGLTMTISELSGVYTLSGASWTSDTETFTLRAVYQGVTIDQTYTITKSKAGAAGSNGTNGADAKLIALAANRQQIKFNSAGALNPTTQDTVFTVTRQNTAVAAVWTIFDLAGNAASGALLTGSGDTRTLTAANFNTARGSTEGVRVVATVTDGAVLSDQITVIRVADGVDANQVRIATNQLTFPFIAHTGKPVAQTATLTANLTAISGTVTWGLIQQNGSTVALNAAYISTSGNTATITHTQFAAFITAFGGTTMRVTATLAGFTDERVFTRVADATSNPAGGSFIRTRNGDVSTGGWLGATTSTTIPAAITRAGARSLQLATNSYERPRISTPIRQGDRFRLRYRIRTIGSGTGPGNIFFALYNDTGTPLTTSLQFDNLPIHAPNTLDWTYVDQVVTYNAATELIDWCAGFDSINATVGNFLVIDFDMDFVPVGSLAGINPTEGTKLTGIETGADITRAISGPGEVRMLFRSDLTLASPLPVAADYQLGVAGGAALTSGVTWAVTVVSGTFASTAPSMVGTGTGQLRLNSALTSPEADLRITATVAGRTYPPFVVRVSRDVAAPTLAPLTSISTSSFVQAHDTPIQVTLPSSATSVTLTAVADLLLQAILPQGGTSVEGKWQRESSPGTWVDVGAVATSSPSPEVFEVELAPGEVFYTAEPGSITCNRTATGLAGGSVQRFRFVARVSLGNVRLVTFLGNASATA